MKVTKLKVLVYDIETAPGEAYFWRAKTQFIPHQMVKHPPFMLCWSASYLGEKKIHSDKLANFEIPERNDARIVESLADKIREADLILAHNGDGFDLPWVRGRLWVNDLEPLGPVQSIDTKKASARDFALTHNNLDYLAKIKGFDQKDKTDFSWWVDITNGNEVTLNKMVRYNRKDVRILKEVYESMMSHITRLPRLVDVQGSACQYCGSTDLQKRGKRRTSAFTYQRFQCNTCGRYSRFKTHDGTHQTTLRPT